MRDIKQIKKTKTEKYIFTEKSVEKTETTNLSKRDISIFSSVFFGLMTVSTFCYIFFVSSTVFYAVKTSKFSYQSENLVKTTYIVSAPTLENIKTDSSRITYINLKEDTNISLK